MKAYQIGPGRIMVWRYPVLNTKCRHFLNNIQLWRNYIKLMIWLSTQRIYILDNTTILDICRLSHGSCSVYYSPELLPSRNPSPNRKMIEKDRTFSRFALSFYSLYYTPAATVSSPGTICRWVHLPTNLCSYVYLRYENTCSEGTLFSQNFKRVFLETRFFKTARTLTRTIFNIFFLNFNHIFQTKFWRETRTDLSIS